MTCNLGMHSGTETLRNSTSHERHAALKSRSSRTGALSFLEILSLLFKVLHMVPVKDDNVNRDLSAKLDEAKKQQLG